MLHPEDVAAVNDEIMALRATVECKHIVSFHKVHEDANITHIITERMEGRRLIDRLPEINNLKESNAKDVTRNLISGIAYCHLKKIANRNLTLDNILLVRTSQVLSNLLRFVHSSNYMPVNRPRGAWTMSKLLISSLQKK
jgi:serine/threonine protein kinase